MLSRLLDLRLRGVLRKYGLANTPEVRRLLRLSWLNGFTFGAFERQVAAARREALEALPYRKYRFMSCPCGRGQFSLCTGCPYRTCPVHGQEAE